ncbi:trypsin-like peptidase domain-containing protein [Neorhodopirellula pilleata]|uniref:Putative serine protease HtrA n=1 Tax=Neorhodopirellula pilleata TaxID=2714738 RepID=A0A5C6AVU6_9BACT|nr:trypsin-like peptidase domain-containing protein [Neorhodopirellula pilleata]TWU03880.1 putative serine protease HtrA [Neorhodopirellula pilleata]
MLFAILRLSGRMPIRYSRVVDTAVTLCLLASMLLPKPAMAQLRPEILDLVKRASVLIEYDDGENRSSGSGFIVWSDNHNTLIATNHHVVAEAIEPPGNPNLSPRDTLLKCISNPGSPEERIVFATVHAYSAADDLALLAVANFLPPAVLQPSRDFVPLETQRVYVAGFPFGEILGVGGRRPNVTISETTVSSIRRGLEGIPEYLQTSGGIDPGNSGGPVIDADGHLVGISVAKVTHSQIGLAVPAWKLVELMPHSFGDVVLQRGDFGLQCGVNAFFDVGGGITQTPVLTAARFDNKSSIKLKRDDMGWLAIEGLQKIGSMGSLTPGATLNNVIPLKIERIPGDGPVIALQWKMPRDPRLPNPTRREHYSRPLIVDMDQIDELMNAATKPDAVAAARGAQNRPLTDTDTVIDFKGSIRRVIPAGDGRYLVVQLADLSIVLVDLQTKTESGRIEDSRDRIIVAGRSTIVTFGRTERNLKRYRLPDLVPSGTRDLANDAVIHLADWGASTDGPVSVIAQMPGQSVLSTLLLDQKTGRFSSFLLEGQVREKTRQPTLLDRMPLKAKYSLRMNDKGNVVSMWMEATSKPVVHLMTQQRREWRYDQLEKTAYAYVSPTGALLCTSGTVLAGDLGMLYDRPLNLPTSSDDYFLSLGHITRETAEEARLNREASLSGPRPRSDEPQTVDFSWEVVSTVDGKVHRTIVLPGNLTLDMMGMDANDGLPLDERFFCSPQHNLIACVLPDQSQEIHLIEMKTPLPGYEPQESNPESDPDASIKIANQNNPLQDEVPDIDEFRTWTDYSGKHKTEAKFLAAKQGYVQLQKRDGAKVVLKIQLLCEPDQKFLRNLLK